MGSHYYLAPVILLIIFVLTFLKTFSVLMFLIVNNNSHCLLSPQTSRYGSTKCGLRQLHASLLKECKRSKVGIHTASPGMVLTDLLLRYVGMS